VASRKQRKKREKEFRHDHVWVDEDGNELDAPPVREEAPKQAKAAGGTKGSQSRWTKTPQPPSWERVAKRTALFAPVILLLVFVLPSKGSSKVSTIGTALLFIAIFVPFSYMVDGFTYRAYQKRMNGGVAPKKKDAGDGKGGGKPGGRPGSKRG
jgi:hypothetical protein